MTVGELCRVGNYTYVVVEAIVGLAGKTGRASWTEDSDE